MEQTLVKSGGYPEKHDEIVAAKMVVVYTQRCEKDISDLQELEIESVEGGSGVYYVLKTERWAINDLDEIIKVLNDFKKRFPTT